MSPSTDPAEDPLSIILDDVQVSVCAVHEVAEPPPPDEGLRPNVPGFVAVCSGECLCRSDDAPPVQLHAGELLFLMRGGPYCVEPQGVSQSGRDAGPGVGACDGASTGSIRLIVGAVRLTEHCESTIGSLVPDVFQLPAGNDESHRSAALVRHFIEECGSTAPGASAIRDQLARIAVCTAVRSRIQDEDFPSIGIARALTDAEIGPIIAAIHRAPGRPWTIDRLASIGSLSRTSFSQRFRMLAGVPVMEYVTDYRMRLAAEMLINSRRPLKEIAGNVGYRSLSAFGTAFKRWSGTAPEVFRRDLNSVAGRILATEIGQNRTDGHEAPSCRSQPSHVSDESDLRIDP